MNYPLSNVLVYMVFMLCSCIGFSQHENGQNTHTNIRFDLEYLRPTQDNRNIKTLSLNWLFGRGRFANNPFKLGYGITTTYAWGSIIRDDESHQKVELENKAFGIGPVFQLRYELFINDRFSISPEFLGGLIFYSSKFPAGGDIYNFMWRIGTTVNYRFSNSKYTLGVGVKWMHISNGQKFFPKNPSYNARGFGFFVARYI